MIELPKQPTRVLNQAQLEAFEKMRKLLSDTQKADQVYDKLDGSKNGSVISTDLACYLDATYAKEPSKGGTRDIDPGWDLACIYAEDRLDREIRERSERKRLRLMSGGWKNLRAAERTKRPARSSLGRHASENRMGSGKN